MRFLLGLLGVCCFGLPLPAAVTVTSIIQTVETGAILQPGGPGFEQNNGAFSNAAGLLVASSTAGGQTGNPTVREGFENNLTINSTNTEFGFLGLHSTEITPGAFGFLASDAGTSYPGGSGQTGFGGVNVNFTITDPMKWSLSGLFDTTGVATSGPVWSVGNVAIGLVDSSLISIQEYEADSPGGPAALPFNGSGTLLPGDYVIGLSSIVGLHTTGNSAPAFGGSAGWNVTFKLTAVPEPSLALALAVASTGFAANRRRRNC